MPAKGRLCGLKTVQILQASCYTALIIVPKNILMLKYYLILFLSPFTNDKFEKYGFYLIDLGP